MGSTRPLFPLYVICDGDACARAGWTLVDFAAACLDGGARFLQIRAKSLAGNDFLCATEAIVRRAEPGGAIVIVNDRADIARMSGAAGVHVGQEDLSPAQARVLVGADALVGISTHTSEQFEAALQPAAALVSYVAAGPVFATTTKDTGRQPIGLDRVRAAATRAADRGVPLVAIGGITLDRAAAVMNAGAHSVAVISDLLVSGDPRHRVQQFLDAIR